MVREPLISYRLHHAAMHRDIDLLATDKLRAYERMFADPAAAELLPMRRRCYGNLHLMLAGSYFYARQHRKAISHMCRSLFIWGPGLSYLAGLPARRLRRRFRPPATNREPVI